MEDDWLKTITDKEIENQHVDWEKTSREIAANACIPPKQISKTESVAPCRPREQSIDILTNEVHMLQKTVMQLQKQLKRQQKRENAMSITEYVGDLYWLDNKQQTEIESHLREFIEINNIFILDEQIPRPTLSAQLLK